RVVGIVDDRIVRPGTGRNRARVDRVPRLAVAVGALEREPAAHRLRHARGHRPRAADALVLEHDVLDDLIACRVIDAVHAWARRRRPTHHANPPGPVVWAGERRL